MKRGRSKEGGIVGEVKNALVWVGVLDAEPCTHVDLEEPNRTSRSRQCESPSNTGAPRGKKRLLQGYLR